MRALHILLLIAAVILAVLLYFEKCNKSKDNTGELKDLISALNDTLRTYKNKDSNNVATISVLQTQSIRDFTNLKIKDEEVKQLQAVVTDYKNRLGNGSSVTNASIETTTSSTSPTIITKYDTVVKDSAVYVYPTYKDTAKAAQKKWIDYTIVANKDSVSFDLKVKNDFSVIVGRDKKGPFVDLITENPYSETKKLRTYQVAVPKPKRWGIGPSAGVGVSTDFKIKPFLGFTVQYNFIRL